MAKRFVDTDIWKKAWYRKLPCRLKELWRYLCENCNGAGIWEADYEAASFLLGEQVTDADIRAFGERVAVLPDGKVFIRRFVEFQYGALSPDCKPHQKVISLLERYGIDPKTLTLSIPLPKGIQRDKEEEEEEDKEEEEKGGVGGNQPDEPPAGSGPPSTVAQASAQCGTSSPPGGSSPPSFPVTDQDQELCERVWLETLETLGVKRTTGCTYQERVAIREGITRHGVAVVSHALVGRRIEPPTQSFHPKNYTSIHRTFKPDKIDEFADLGKRYVAERKKKSLEHDEFDRELARTKRELGIGA